MSRIASRFAGLREAGRGALIPFLEAWDPDRATSMAILRGMPLAGADLIEIGMPFTDPMADGPIIQAAGKRGLKAGVKVRHVLTMVREFRVSDATTPVILMGYLNPILSYGPEKFCVDAAAAGVDGLIIVDLPPEEADMLLPYAQANGLDVIRLVAPTTDDERLPQVMNGSSGFVYYVEHHGDHRHAQRDDGASDGGDPAHPKSDRSADRDRVWRAHAGSGGGGVAGGGRGGGGLGVDRDAVETFGRSGECHAGRRGRGAGSGARPRGSGAPGADLNPLT